MDDAKATFLRRLEEVRALAEAELAEMDQARAELRAVVRAAERLLGGPRKPHPERVLAAIAEHQGIRGSMIPTLTGQRDESVRAAIAELADQGAISRDGLGWRVS